MSDEPKAFELIYRSALERQQEIDRLTFDPARETEILRQKLIGTFDTKATGTVH